MDWRRIFGAGTASHGWLCVVGARKFLIAWNINLRTADVAVVRTFAREIRDPLRFARREGDRAAASHAGAGAGSVNLVDFERTPLLCRLTDAVADRCKARGMRSPEAKLIGMILSAALASSARGTI